MSQTDARRSKEMDGWVEISGEGIKNDLTGLAQMLGDQIAPTIQGSRVIPLEGAVDLVGGAEATATAVYLSVSGSAEGHMTLVYSPEIAFKLVDMAMGDPVGTCDSLGELEASVLGEIGNVMGAYFLRTLVERSGMDLRVSPPSVMMDMAGAVLDGVIATVMMQFDDAVVVDAEFGAEDNRIKGAFLVMPSPELIAGLSRGEAA